jgi:hypothetical protein
MKTILADNVMSKETLLCIEIFPYIFLSNKSRYYTMGVP